MEKILETKPLLGRRGKVIGKAMLISNSVRHRRWIPISVASKLYDIPAYRLYGWKKRGSFPCRVLGVKKVLVDRTGMPSWLLGNTDMGHHPRSLIGTKPVKDLYPKFEPSKTIWKLKLNRKVKKMKAKPTWISIHQAKEYFNVSDWMIREWVKKPHFPARNLGKLSKTSSYQIHRVKAEEFLEGGEVNDAIGSMSIEDWRAIGNAGKGS